MKAKLQQVFGLIHSQRGQYTQARETLEAALAEQRLLLGPDHLTRSIVVCARAGVLRLWRRGAGSHSSPGSLDRHRRVYGDEHEKTARALFAMAPLAPISTLPERCFHRRSSSTAGVASKPSRRGHEPGRSGPIPQSESATGSGRGRSTCRPWPSSRAPAARHPKAIGLMSDYASLLSDMNLEAEAEPIKGQRSNWAVKCLVTAR